VPLQLSLSPGLLRSVRQKNKVPNVSGPCWTPLLAADGDLRRVCAADGPARDTAATARGRSSETVPSTRDVHYHIRHDYHHSDFRRRVSSHAAIVDIKNTTSTLLYL
jgi:hypothetical protein